MEPEIPPAATGRPLAGTEMSWYQAVPGGTGITVLALLLSRPIPSLLHSALHKLQNSHPILRATFPPTSPASLSIPPSPSPLQIQTLSPSHTSLILTRVLPDDPPSSVSPFHALLEHELNQNPWSEPGSDPPRALFATVYELPPGPGAGPAGSVLALRFHTAVCDRTSGVAILKELMGLMGDGGISGMEQEEEGKGGVILGIEDLIPKQDAWKPFWARGKDLVGYSVNGLRSAVLRFEDAGSDRSSEVVRLVLAADETRKLLSACKAKGVKLCGALSGAALIATYSYNHHEDTQPEMYTMVTLMDCRKYLNPVLNERHVGFYHSGVVNTHTVHRDESFWEVAMRCHCSYSTAKSNKKHLKDIGELNYLMCKAIENPHLTPSSSLRTALISVFEEPLMYESSELQRDLGVEDYVGCASAHGVGPSIAVFDTIRDGQLDCAMVYPSPLHSRKQMTELVEHMKRILLDGSHVDEQPQFG